MIAFLRGTLVGGGEIVLLDVGGIGFAVQVSARTAQALPPPGSNLCLYTWLQVREDGVGLYGFLEAAERDLFLTLLEVNGLGPKVALNLLSVFPGNRLVEIIGRGDAASLMRAPGVGQKLAQRIVLELKDKVLRRGAEAVAAVPSAAGEALAALAALGFGPQEAEELLSQAVRSLGGSRSTEELVACCLRIAGQTGGR